MVTSFRNIHRFTLTISLTSKNYSTLFVADRFINLHANSIHRCNMKMSDFVKQLHESGVEYEISNPFLVIPSNWRVDSSGHVAIFGRYEVVSFNTEVPFFVSGKNLILMSAPLDIKLFQYKKQRTENFINKNKIDKSGNDNKTAYTTNNKETKSYKNNYSRENSGPNNGQPTEGGSEGKQ